MECTNIPFEQTQQFSRLFLDYVSGKESLRTFYGYSPDLQSFESVIGQRNFSAEKRIILAEALELQYTGTEVSGLTKANIEALRQPNCYTVTTGHQLCLFTGPLYFIYKIVTTIKLAEKLKATYPEYTFVPVYWMATEDHDFAEINHAHLFNGKKIVWDIPATGAVGELSTATLAPVLEELAEVLGDRGVESGIVDRIQSAYLKSDNLAEATRTFVNDLFGEQGLVIVDGNHQTLKRQFIPHILRDLVEHDAQKQVSETSEKLNQLGYKTQVNPRAINLFYLEKGLRERIEKSEHGYRVVNTNLEFSTEQLQQQLESNPEKFSPNVILRPLYQEAILPNLAYIGGPGELAYWLQLKDFFDAQAVDFPILMPRNFCLWVDAGLGKKMDKLNLSPPQLFQDHAMLKKELVQSEATNTLDLEREKAQMAHQFASILEKALAIDPTLKGPVEGEKVKALKGLEGLEKRLLKAEKQKHEVSLKQLETILAKLFPSGSLQERHDNFLPFYLKHKAAFIETLFDTFDPFSKEFLILSE